MSGLSKNLYQLLRSRFHPEEQAIKDHIIQLMKFHPSPELMSLVDYETRIEIQHWDGERPFKTKKIVAKACFCARLDYDINIPEHAEIIESETKRLGDEWRNFCGVAYDTICMKGVDCPDEIVLINNFSEDDEPIQEYFYCLPEDVESYRQKAIAKALEPLNTAQTIKANELAPIKQ